jgi:hypothetical protein
MPGRERRLFEQAYRLDHDFPDGKTKLRAGLLVWTGLLTPTPLAREYTVRIRYARGQFPRVVLVNPRLESAEQELLHHLYPNGDLCLHRFDEWNPSMLLIETIVPWTSEWLAHYELWKRTHQWYGDGEDDGVGEGPPMRDREPIADEAVGRPHGQRRSERSAQRTRRHHHRP